jgi:hypothetical protein
MNKSRISMKKSGIARPFPDTAAASEITSIGDDEE